MTNGDKIRNMTNDELASLFVKLSAGNQCAQLNGIWPEKDIEEHTKYFMKLNWVDWLKSETNIDKEPDFTNHTGNTFVKN